jgi:hypothetical protein
VTQRGWYRVIVTDKPSCDQYPDMVWIWRVVNSRGEIVASCVRQYASERQARRAAKQILGRITWRSGTTIKTNR